MFMEKFKIKIYHYKIYQLIIIKLKYFYRKKLKCSINFITRKSKISQQ